jgi:hypothetical protein
MDDDRTCYQIIRDTQTNVWDSCSNYVRTVDYDRIIAINKPFDDVHVMMVAVYGTSLELAIKKAMDV